jgi:hypothetical protein
VEAQGDHISRLLRVIGEERDARIRAELRVRVYAEIMVTICHRLAVEQKVKPDIVIRNAQKEVSERLKDYDSGWMDT